MFISKKIRWTLYTLVIVGFIVGGWYLTMTEQPEQYMPHEQPDDEALGEVDPDHAERTGVGAEADAGFSVDARTDADESDEDR